MAGLPSCCHRVVWPCRRGSCRSRSTASEWQPALGLPDRVVHPGRAACPDRRVRAGRRASTRCGAACTVHGRWCRIGIRAPCSRRAGGALQRRSGIGEEPCQIRATRSSPPATVAAAQPLLPPRPVAAGHRTALDPSTGSSASRTRLDAKLRTDRGHQLLQQPGPVAARRAWTATLSGVSSSPARWPSSSRMVAVMVTLTMPCGPWPAGERPQPASVSARSSTCRAAHHQLEGRLHLVSVSPPPALTRPTRTQPALHTVQAINGSSVFSLQDVGERGDRVSLPGSALPLGDLGQRAHSRTSRPVNQPAASNVLRASSTVRWP